MQPQVAPTVSQLQAAHPTTTEACQLGRYDFMNALREAGADIQAQDNFGLNGLHFTARQSRMDLMEILITWGVDTSSGYPLAITITEHGNINDVRRSHALGINSMSPMNRGRRPSTAQRCLVIYRFCANLYHGTSIFKRIYILVTPRINFVETMSGMQHSSQQIQATLKY